MRKLARKPEELIAEKIIDQALNDLAMHKAGVTQSCGEYIEKYVEDSLDLLMGWRLEVWAEIAGLDVREIRKDIEGWEK
jgi:hypothetical protein